MLTTIKPAKKNSYFGVFVPLLIIAILIVAANFILIPAIKQQMLEQRKIMIKEMVHSAYSLLVVYEKMAKNNQLSLDEAQEIALESIRNLHYGTDNKNYFWISNKENKLLAHPYFKYNNISKNDSVYDITLKRISDLVKQKNEGFIEYNWQFNDDSNRYEAKISYVKCYEEWGWIIGTGFYKKEAYSEIDLVTDNITLYTSVITSGILIFLILIIRRSIKNSQSIKKKNIELATSESRFKGLTNTALNGLVIYENEKVVFINKQCYEFLGYKENETIDTNFMNYVVEEDRDRVYNFIATTNRRSEQLNEIGYWIKNKLGEKKYILNKFVYEQKDANTLLTYVIASDMTEVKNYESKLKQLSDTISQVPASVIITDLEGNIEYVNPVFEKITGYTFDEVYGRKPSILKSGQMPESVYSDLWSTVQNGEIWSHDLLNRKKNGELIWESAIIFPLKNDNHEIVNYAAVNLDITENKKLNEELIRTREKALQGEKIKTAFLGNVSHEVHTPLNAISGFTQLLIDANAGNQKTLSYLQIIDRNTNILIQLFADIVEYSRIESGDIEISRSSFSLNELISKICSRYNTKIATEQKAIELSILPDSNFPDIQITTDKRLFSQILDKLLSNAYKFTLKGHIKIGYRVLEQKIEIFVEDTGAGISDEEKNKIFMPFYHSEKDFVSLHKGTGLGLNIAQKFIELLGGELQYRSMVNFGSTFYFTLPVSHSKSKRESKTVRDTKNSIFSTLTILVVEDNESNFLYLRHIFSKLGATVLWAKNGVDGIKMLEKNINIGLILMDILMPVMDGLQATRILRHSGTKIPIIAQTAIDDETLYRNKDLFDGIVHKPVNRIMLLELINTILSGDTKK